MEEPFLSAVECTGVRQTEIHTAEPMVPELSVCEFEMAIEKVITNKSPGTDHIPAELMKAGGRIIRSEIHKLINLIWYKEELPEEWKKSIIIRRVIKPPPYWFVSFHILAYQHKPQHISFYQYFIF